MTKVLRHEARRLVVPPGYRRDRAVKPAGQAPDSHERYDFDTLFYQAIRTDRGLTIVAPKLLNFESLVRKARFYVDGTRVRRIRIRRYYRHAILHFPNAPAGTVLRAVFPNGQERDTPIVSPMHDHLAGLNCEMLISKDNDLDWLQERLAFHTARCDLQGLCFIDNGSTAYGLDDIEDMLEKSALKRAVLLSMPFKWGGINRKPRHRELFLQTAAYNVCRLMFLATARAVARLDADEILIPRESGQTVFDHAVNSQFGFVCFLGANRFPGAMVEGKARFADHVWQVQGKEVAGNNWCLRPDAALARLQWRCHNLEHNLLDRWQYLEGTHFYHCLGIGTDWKGGARAETDERLSEDLQALKFWEEVYLPAVETAPKQ